MNTIATGPATHQAALLLALRRDERLCYRPSTPAKRLCYSADYLDEQHCYL